MSDLTNAQWKYLLAILAVPAIFLFIRGRRNNSGMERQQTAYNNLRAFLDMIQLAEGTYGGNAYRTLYGGGLFSGYGWHPNIAVTKNGITSTAAGAYQILYGTWTGIAQQTGLPDFSPASQDKAAVALIARRGALLDVLTGRFTDAVYKCRLEWASFPGAGYGQGERPLAMLMEVYQRQGGQIV